MQAASPSIGGRLRRRVGTPAVGRERAIALVVTLAVLLFVLGSTKQPEAKRVADLLRWAPLLIGAIAAIWFIARTPGHIRSRVRDWTALHWIVFGIAVLALASASWSVVPALSFERGGSFLVLFLAVGVLGSQLVCDTAAVTAAADGVVYAAGIVYAAGFLLLLVDPHLAVQSQTYYTPTRFRGLGENPNTVPMLAIFAVPLAIARITQVRSGVRQLFAAIIVLALCTVFASGSRTALAALFVALVAYVMLIPLSRQRRVLALGAIVVLTVIGTVATSEILQPGKNYATAAQVRKAVDSIRPARSSTKPATTTPATATTPATGATTVPGKRTSTSALPSASTVPPIARVALPQQGALSNAVPRINTVVDASGRVAAWRFTLHKIVRRPLLGYGFGSETHIIDSADGTLPVFEGGSVENSYLGITLQLGAVGLLLLLAALVVVATAVHRLLQAHMNRPAQILVAAFAGAVLGGAVLGLGQSFVYSVGDLATIPFWLSAFAIMWLAQNAQAT